MRLLTRLAVAGATGLLFWSVIMSLASAQCSSGSCGSGGAALRPFRSEPIISADFGRGVDRPRLPTGARQPGPPPVDAITHVRFEDYFRPRLIFVRGPFWRLHSRTVWEPIPNRNPPAAQRWEPTAEGKGAGAGSAKSAEPAYPSPDRGYSATPVDRPR